MLVLASHAVCPKHICANGIAKLCRVSTFKLKQGHISLAARRIRFPLQVESTHPVYVCVWGCVSAYGWMANFTPVLTATYQQISRKATVDFAYVFAHSSMSTSIPTQCTLPAPRLPLLICRKHISTMINRNAFCGCTCGQMVMHCLSISSPAAGW